MKNKKVIIAAILVIAAGSSVFYSFKAMQGGGGSGDAAANDSFGKLEDSDGSAIMPVDGPPGGSSSTGDGFGDPGGPGDDESVADSGGTDFDPGGAGDSSIDDPAGSGDSMEFLTDDGETGGAAGGRIDDVLSILEQSKTKMGFGKIPPPEEEVVTPPSENDSSPVQTGSGNGAQERAAVVDVLAGMKVQGILMGEKSSCALVGGYILREGDSLPGGYRVTKINRRSVSFLKEGKEEEIVKFLEPLGSRSRQTTAPEETAAPIE